jgi:hypothetical protein
MGKMANETNCVRKRKDAAIFSLGFSYRRIESSEKRIFNENARAG